MIGLFNLLPILPLDGGKLMQAALSQTLCVSSNAGMGYKNQSRVQCDYDWLFYYSYGFI